MAQMVQQNGNLRAMLLQSAPRMRKSLGNFSGGTLGGTTRVKLFNVGITTKLILNVSVSVDIGVAIATASPKAPFNIINRIKLTDFDGTDRVNCSGFQLATLQCVREKHAYGYNNDSQTSVLANPAVPTAIAAGQNLQFIIEVPLAFSDTDLRGALLTQTAVGEAWLSLDWNSLLYQSLNDDAVYNGAPTTTVALSAGATIQVAVEQEYLLPQSIGGQVPLPALDLMTVYELSGALRSADNIAVGSEKLFNYPNVRSVIGAYFSYLNNGVMHTPTTDLTRVRLIANGNNVLREYTPFTKLFDMRKLINGDWRVGTIWELSREKPIQTALFGNVQYGITFAAVTAGNTNVEVMFESFYTKGSTLPGLSQASG
ncbi:hypothetical protein [Metallibacterium sp.]